MISQPQTFTSMRRALGLSSKTVSKSIRRLMELGYVRLDERYLYWIIEG